MSPGWVHRSNSVTVVASPDEGRAAPHRFSGHEGLGEQARAGLAVLGAGWTGQLHRRYAPVVPVDRSSSS